MSLSVWQRMDLTARHLIPAVSLVVLVLLSVAPLRIPGYADIAPLLVLMGAYYWSIVRMDLCPPWLLLLVGLFEDLLSGTLLGVNPFLYLLTHAVVRSQHKFLSSKPFFVGWAAFGPVAAVAAAIKWLSLLIVHNTLPGAGPVFFSLLLTVGLYPLIGRALAWLSVNVIKDEDGA